MISALILARTEIKPDSSNFGLPILRGLECKPRLFMLMSTLDNPIFGNLPHVHLSWANCCPVDAHAQASRHPMLIPQLKVLHQHSVELISKLIQQISKLISVQPKWKVISAVSGLLSAHFKSNSILNIQIRFQHSQTVC
jgi:hypothetical protein